MLYVAPTGNQVGVGCDEVVPSPRFVKAYCNKDDERVLVAMFPTGIPWHVIDMKYVEFVPWKEFAQVNIDDRKNSLAYRKEVLEIEKELSKVTAGIERAGMIDGHFDESPGSPYDIRRGYH